MMINFIVVDIPPLFWTLVNLVRHLVSPYIHAGYLPTDLSKGFISGGFTLN